METLEESYRLCKQNKGSAGIDGVTFEQVEKEGVDKLLTEIQQELKSGTYLPMRNRIHHIPKGNGKTRKLGIPKLLSYYMSLQFVLGMFLYMSIKYP